MNHLRLRRRFIVSRSLNHGVLVLHCFSGRETQTIM